jgi:ubiquinone/menaquinone biosynthesis C-methylase UbiE
MRETMSKSERFWDRSAKGFNGRVDADDQAAVATLECARKYLHRNDMVLDFGCAAGKYALEIAPSVEEVWGIDISTEMIKTAKRNAAGSDFSNVRFLRADITDLRLKAESFNIILAFNILHLVGDPVQTLTKIKDLLQPDGILLSVTPCLGIGSSLQELLIKCGSLLGIVPAVHAFKPNDVDELIREAQFETLESHIITDQFSVVFIAARRMV